MPDNNRVHVEYSRSALGRGIGFWLRPRNLAAARRKFLRSDFSNEWRYQFCEPHCTPRRTVSYSTLLNGSSQDGFRFIILGDTGEGDRSQYSLLPLIRHLDPDFMIINGDVTYPAGSIEDYEEGLFKPYQGLDIPIWAVPGNHDYYSRSQGAEFYETFCTRKWAARWARYGLRLVPQPGTYWELKDPSGTTPLVVIGIDSGKTGDLDGARKHGPDTAQHRWLQQRLELAQRNDQVVLVLFHIPMLVNGKHQKGIRFIKKGVTLYNLHYLLGKYACVKMVVGAHIHNYQAYNQNVFRAFLDDVAPATKNSGSQPHYAVSGGGGAALSHTDFKAKGYPPDAVFPSATDWKAHAAWARRQVDNAGLSRTALGRLAGLFDEGVLSDADEGKYLSFLCVDVKLEAVEVYPVWMKDVEQLFGHLPLGSVVDVQNPMQAIDETAVKQYVGPPIILWQRP